MDIIKGKRGKVYDCLCFIFGHKPNLLKNPYKVEDAPNRICRRCWKTWRENETNGD